MRFFILSILFLLPRGALAESEVELEEGMRMSIEGAVISLLAQGKPIWSEPISSKQAEGQGTLAIHRLSDNTVAVHAVAPLKGGGATEAVVLKTMGRTDVSVIWNEETGLKGDIGERIGKAVRFEDLTGDGSPEIVVGEVSEMVRLCGQDSLPLLFRTVYDPKKGVFRPVLAKRPGLEAGQDLEGTSSANPPEAQLVEPLIPASASRALGDKGSAALLPIPYETTDRDPQTAWMPFPRNGAGEFMTFRTSSGAYGITRLGIKPLPNEDSKKRRPSYDRPKSIILTTEKSIFRLTIKEDPKDARDNVYWFDFPAPEKTRCLSIVIETSFEPSDKLLCPIAEIYAETEIDGPDGLSRLASDLNSPKLRRQAAMLLGKAGNKGAEAVRGVWKTLDQPGRRLAVDTLVAISPEDSMDLLAEAALSADELVRGTAIAGLKTTPRAAVPVVVKHLDTDDDEMFESAAALMAELDVSEAIEALVSFTGKGNRSRRLSLRRILVQASVGRAEQTERIYFHLREADEAGRREQMFDLLRVGAALSDLKDRIYDMAVRIHDGADTFEDRYRSIEALGKLGCGFPVDRLLSAARDKDLYLRKIAVEGLGQCRAPGAEEAVAINAALSDEAVLVRLAALDAMEGAGLVERGFDSLKRLLKTDPWPVVRARTAGLARRLSPPRAVQILELVAGDESMAVREAALDSAIVIKGRRADAIIEGRLADVKEASRIKLKAIAAVGRRCQSSAVPLLLSLLKEGAEPLAPKENIELAVAAAKALGAIGGPEAVDALEEASRRSNPATDKAIETALKENGRFCRKGEALKVIPAWEDR